ncbi:superoxide dismutase family protein [Chelatococcus sp. GCM10030263]|uniref:superoxide dismutase family protein n=1 Tax=Chelatococcus sp. GCM10030263 TaxID=3273387 RepID=UPI00360B8EE4
MKPLLLGLLVAGSTGLAALAQSTPTVKATFHNVEGESIGTATLTETPSGVLVSLDLKGLPPGEHAFHIHETGRCDAASGFESAGGHFGPGDRRHGFKDEHGPHAGDMPNQFVAADGVLRAEVFNPNVTLASGDAAHRAALFDSNGAALVIHDGVDDYASQPSGEAGSRIACAVIEKS